jgi:hypothetical protein
VIFPYEVKEMVGVKGNFASVLIQTSLSFTVFYFKLGIPYFAYLLLIIMKDEN